MIEYVSFSCSEKDYNPLLNLYAKEGYHLVTAFSHPHGGATIFMERNKP